MTNIGDFQPHDAPALNQKPAESPWEPPGCSGAPIRLRLLRRMSKYWGSAKDNPTQKQADKPMTYYTTLPSVAPRTKPEDRGRDQHITGFIGQQTGDKSDRIESVGVAEILQNSEGTTVPNTAPSR